MSNDSHYHLGKTHHRSDGTETDEHRLRWPETGGFKILLEMALVYHLVVVATPVLVEQVGVLHPTIVPEPFTTVLYALLWVGLGAVVVWIFLSASLVSTHRFDDEDGVEEYLERELPDRRWFWTNGGMAVFGGALVWMTYERFVAAFLHVVDLLVIVVEEFDWALTLTDGLYTVGFLGGFLLFAIGMDRLVVGGVRTHIRRRHESS